MRSFKCCNGLNWDIHITVLTAKKIKSRTGIDIHSIFEESTLQRVASDVDVTTDLLWCLVESQAKDRGIDYDAFYSTSIDSDNFAKAIDLIFDAVVDYFPPQKKTHAEKVLRILRSTGTEIIDRLTAKISQMDERQTIDQILAEVDRQLETMANPGIPEIPGRP